MSKRRVVVTGLGVLTPIGNNLHDYWEALKAGKSGACPISKFDTERFDTKFACEVQNFDPQDFMDRKEARRMDNFTQYAMATAQMAMDDSKIDLEKVDHERIGVVYGSGIGGMDTFETQHTAFMEHGPKRISPFFVPMMISDIAAGQISIRFRLKGPNYATTSACATSSHAIADAFILIQRGSADVMVCGGSESSITPMAIGGFNSARALSTWNDRMEIASRPFDKDRNGFVMGEGSGTLILEDYDHAIARGAQIYAEISGVGLTGDAYHLTAPAPGGEGAVRSMREAVRDAGIELTDIDYINAHGTSTELNDANETAAIKTLFGDHAYNLVVSSTKSMTGHLLGAAGAIESIASILSIKNSLIPPTINLDEPSPECDLNYSAKKITEKEIKFALSNTFGFGGHNASLIFNKFEE
ncbi:MAG: beta-ketoacyl-ACP synthase II [Melioribacteraceae bacterium]|nr:beta-ketoacyl-ACP synthase II [Melioribacteraceae bacterium]MCF8264441.1 beta-ketoacyl-ACP synthase II [Melioribacteraceae bacterium]MCF8414185.1 beta-ketoacyl-ACP synthase II [Melioribacteraceae bacterium]MCF8432222.1 beta-ketoacyl-ACP synthase II [Melioribacteraceae bacterium]